MCGRRRCSPSGLPPHPGTAGPGQGALIEGPSPTWFPAKQAEAPPTFRLPPPTPSSPAGRLSPPGRRGWHGMAPRSSPRDRWPQLPQRRSAREGETPALERAVQPRRHHHAARTPAAASALTCPWWWGGRAWRRRVVAAFSSHGGAHDDRCPLGVHRHSRARLAVSVPLARAGEGAPCHRPAASATRRRGDPDRTARHRSVVRHRPSASASRAACWRHAAWREAVGTVASRGGWGLKKKTDASSDTHPNPPAPNPPHARTHPTVST